jgi:hypothetical protein
VRTPDRIADALRRVDEIGPDEAVYRRAQTGPRGADPPREPGGRARLVAGVTAFAVFAAAALFAWNAFRPETRTEGPTPTRPTPTDVAQVTTIDGWQVEVSVTPQQVGPIAISVGPAEAAPANDAHPWFQHDLMFENTGDRGVTFADTRTSRFIGPGGRHRLIVADKGCGYGIDPSGRARPGTCLLYLDAFTVEPGRSETRPVTTFEGLPGMAPLRSGTYVFPRKIEFHVAGGAPIRATLRISYRLTETPDAVTRVPACVDSELRVSPVLGGDEPIPPRPYGIGVGVKVDSRTGSPCKVDVHLSIEIRNAAGTAMTLSGAASAHFVGRVPPGGRHTATAWWRVGDWCPPRSNLPISVAVYLDDQFVRVDRVHVLDGCTEGNILSGAAKRRGTGSPSLTRMPS